MKDKVTIFALVLIVIFVSIWFMFGFNKTKESGVQTVYIESEPEIKEVIVYVTPESTPEITPSPTIEFIKSTMEYQVYIQKYIKQIKKMYWIGEIKYIDVDEFTNNIKHYRCRNKDNIYFGEYDEYVVYNSENNYTIHDEGNDQVVYIIKPEDFKVISNIIENRVKKAYEIERIKRSEQDKVLDNILKRYVK